MSQDNPGPVTILPRPQRWHGDPVQWEWAADDTLTITAGPQTDWFINPNTAQPTGNAPALLMPITEPFMLQALVEVDHVATFDAGVLAIYHGSDVWAKLCLEFSPQGQAMIVSVVTNGISDDCNSVTIPGYAIYLRVAKLDRAYAFHYSTDGQYWNLVRHFTLGESTSAEVGFLAQSPTGEGCTARFTEIVYRAEKLADIRSGE